MFNFVKELQVIGTISSALGKIVHKLCGVDLLSELTIKDRNTIASSILEELEKLHCKKFLKPNDIPVDDAMVLGFLILAKKITPGNAIKHQLVLMGLMRYLDAALNQNGSVSKEILIESKNYISAFNFPKE